MPSHRIFVLIALVLSLAVIGCAKQKTPIPGSRGPGNRNVPPVNQTQPTVQAPTQPQATPQNVTGAWTTGCLPYSDDSGSYYYETRLSLNQGQVSYATDWYSGQCGADTALPEYAYVDTGTYTLGSADVTGVAGARSLDVEFSEYGGWYTIVRADNDVLYLGDDTGTLDGTSTELRPNALRTSRPFRRATSNTSLVAR